MMCDELQFVVEPQGMGGDVKPVPRLMTVGNHLAEEPV
jgi:hypothetical protein